MRRGHRNTVQKDFESGRRAGSVPARRARLLRDRPFWRAASAAAGRSTARPAMQRLVARRLLAAFFN
jgi:hypothetical protein